MTCEVCGLSMSPSSGKRDGRRMALLLAPALATSVNAFSHPPIRWPLQRCGRSSFTECNVHVHIVGTSSCAARDLRQSLARTSCPEDICSILGRRPHGSPRSRAGWARFLTSGHAQRVGHLVVGAGRRRCRTRRASRDGEEDARRSPRLFGLVAESSPITLRVGNGEGDEGLPSLTLEETLHSTDKATASIPDGSNPAKVLMEALVASENHGDFEKAMEVLEELAAMGLLGHLQEYDNDRQRGVGQRGSSLSLRERQQKRVMSVARGALASLISSDRGEEGLNLYRRITRMGIVPDAQFSLELVKRMSQYRQGGDAEWLLHDAFARRGFGSGATPDSGARPGAEGGGSGGGAATVAGGGAPDRGTGGEEGGREGRPKLELPPPLLPLLRHVAIALVRARRPERAAGLLRRARVDWGASLPAGCYAE
ncbi:unnamed protein product, partial [Discosporangium mesarthrocarpum]